MIHSPVIELPEALSRNDDRIGAVYLGVALRVIHHISTDLGDNRLVISDDV